MFAIYGKYISTEDLEKIHTEVLNIRMKIGCCCQAQDEVKKDKTYPKGILKPVDKAQIIIQVLPEKTTESKLVDKTVFPKKVAVTNFVYKRYFY